MEATTANQQQANKTPVHVNIQKEPNKTPVNNPGVSVVHPPINKDDPGNVEPLDYQHIYHDLFGF